ncbi:MAG: energy transducer TonB, partial [SAR324 cluster bacterium]|nr:energy transducer TonB [SAR324 cluster bacterium]
PRIAEKKSEEKNIASTESITDKDGTSKMVRSLAMLKRTPEQEIPLKLPEKPKPSQEVTKKRFSIDLLRFRLAQKKYNQLIWRDIKRSMMFFRQENGYRLESGLKAKVRLSIDETGKVIWKKLMHPSRSSVFNRRILESVNRLSLPPPVEILVQDPPYVVTILIEP